MNAPVNCKEFLDLLRQSGVVSEDRLASYLRTRRAQWKLLTRPTDAATKLLADGILSKFQAQQLLRGKCKGFWINKYLVLESLGTGGMGRVLLCEQTPMTRLVAVKVLPGTTPGAPERFLREGRAVAALDHPNIVRAIDIDQEKRFHFLVIEYVDGINLQDLVDEHGRLGVGRACQYTVQAALGLQHAHEAGWVHRDVKPGNLLVDRSGVVKILDLGLARLTNDEQDKLTKQFDENAILGTADFLAPEQSLPEQIVDARADIYSLGSTLYFLLTGKAPFSEGSVLQKIMAHQLQNPRPISSLRPGLPKELTSLIERMMDKSPARRPQTAREVAEALMALGHDEGYPLAAGEYVDHCPRVRQLLLAMRPKTPLTPHTDVDTPRPATPSVRRFPVLLLGGIAALVLVAGGVIFWLLVLQPSGTATAKPQPNPVAKDKPAVPVVIPGVLTPEEALQNLNKICTVQMVVRSAGMSKNQKMLFLNSQMNYRSENNFTVVVQKLDSGQEIDDFVGYYQDKTIRVTGQVSNYSDQRQIVVPDLQRIEIVTETGKK
jgi:serine/threonine protein kinase